MSGALSAEKFHYRVTTPLYLGGPNPRSPDDARIYLRPVVAHWRWWFRALAGGLVGTNDTGLERVRELEQKYFGGVHEVGGAAAGPMQFRVRLASPGLQKPRAFTANRDPVLNYLGYGLGATRDQPARRGIPPESSFTLEVVATQEVCELLKVLNYLWVNFGGLGARQRRGLGSIEWLDGSGNPPPQDGRSLAQKRERFASLLGMSDEQAKFAGGLSEIPVVHRDFFRVKVCSDTFQSWKDALAAIRNQLRLEVSVGAPPKLHLGAKGFGWRQGNGASHNWTPEYKTIPNRPPFPYYPTRDKTAAWQLFQALSANRRPAQSVSLQNPMFGLPVVFGGWNLVITAYQDEEELRRPSPLSFRVFRNGEQYGVLVVYFKSRFLPSPARLRAVWKRGDETRSCPVQLGADWSYLDDFFDACDGKEVSL